MASRSPHSELAPLISAAELADVTPARVVYWTEPFYILDIPNELSLSEYLARDVERGGFLVVQTTHLLFGSNDDVLPGTTDQFLHMMFDDAQWEVIFKDWISKHAPGEDFVLPTYISGSHFLQIYRRREKVTNTLPHHRGETGWHAVVRFLEGARRRQASGYILGRVPVTAMIVGANLAAIELAVLAI